MCLRAAAQLEAGHTPTGGRAAAHGSAVQEPLASQPEGYLQQEQQHCAAHCAACRGEEKQQPDRRRSRPEVKDLKENRK